MSDFLLQKSPDRGRQYHAAPGIWFSTELKRWMVTSPQLIRQILHDESFIAPSYDISAVTDKLGLRFPHIDALRVCLPIAVEGARHRELRESFARHLARHTPTALAELAARMAGQHTALLGRAAATPFCLYQDFLRPLMVPALLTLAALRLPETWPIETLPLLFDVRLPLKRRRAVDDLIGAIVGAQPESLTQEESYRRAAVLALSVNTLPSSMVLTIMERVRTAPGMPLSTIDWGDELQRTGLPLIEKIAARDVTLADIRIASGEGLRLFLEADGVTPAGEYRHSDLFFAEGNHKCVGMHFSRQAWQRVSRMLGGIDRRLRVLEVSERTHDYVFNFPERCMVQFDD